jgi:hypothetical protein
MQRLVECFLDSSLWSAAHEMTGGKRKQQEKFVPADCDSLPRRPCSNLSASNCLPRCPLEGQEGQQSRISQWPQVWAVEVSKPRKPPWHGMRVLKGALAHVLGARLIMPDQKARAAGCASGPAPAPSTSNVPSSLVHMRFGESMPKPNCIPRPEATQAQEKDFCTLLNDLTAASRDTHPEAPPHTTITTTTSFRQSPHHPAKN